MELLNKKLYGVLALFLFLMLIGIASATVETLGTFKQNTCINLTQSGTGITVCNITSVKYPNSQNAITQTVMNPSNGEYYTNFCSTSQLGEYIVNGFCGNGTDYVSWAYDFKVTGNGKDGADGIIIILFIISIVILAGLTCFLGLYSLGHLLKLDFDLVDLAIDWGLFIALVVVYYMQDYYLGNPDINSWLSMSLIPAGIFFILIPIVAFLLSITIGSINNKGINVGQPAQIRWRRR